MGLSILLKHAQIAVLTQNHFDGSELTVCYILCIFFFYPHFVLVSPLTIKREPNFEIICI